MKTIALLVILVATFCDPIRDALYGKADWWTWHICKWAAFYPPLVYIVLSEWTPFPVWKYWAHRGYWFAWSYWVYIILITLAAQLAWYAGLYAAGWPWTPLTIQWLKGLFA